jgi:ubiquinone/menaquinone biosynthesis C-methylase UbiE
VPYLLPRHASEVDRLDVQHYALRETLGVNHLAPIEPPRRALDVGCGTGQWAFELCKRHPGALVVGLDLVPSTSGQRRWRRRGVAEAGTTPRWGAVHTG